MEAPFKLPLTYQQACWALFKALRYQVEKREQTFIDTEAVRAQIRVLANLLTSNHHEFGALLCGCCGNGKTSLVRALQTVLNSLDMKDNATRRQLGMTLIGAESLVLMCKEDREEFNEYKQKTMLAIDDLGEEPLEILDYGNPLHPIVDLISFRYNRRLFTMVTTNLTPGEIAARYGARIKDRFNEMMVKIVFTDDTFRTPSELNLEPPEEGK